jgi:hypothetical protein
MAGMDEADKTLQEPGLNKALTGKSARQGVLSLTIRDKNLLYSSYMPYIRNGGLFVPTSKKRGPWYGSPLRALAPTSPQVSGCSSAMWTKAPCADVSKPCWRAWSNRTVKPIRCESCPRLRVFLPCCPTWSIATAICRS